MIRTRDGWARPRARARRAAPLMTTNGCDSLKQGRAGSVSERQTAGVAGGCRERVDVVADCRLEVGDGCWRYAVDNADAIAAHWRRRREETPSFFDGVVHLMSHAAIEDGRLHARLLRTDFKSYLHWRDAGFPGAGVRDGFGSAIVLSAEGHLLLGRQRAGNINSGLVYFPGGFIDARDVAADGRVDIEASIVREVVEETGLDPRQGERLAGYRICWSGPQLAIGVGWRFSEPAWLLRQRMLDHLARETASELEDIVVVASVEQLAPAAMPAYARLLLRHLLEDGGQIAADGDLRAWRRP